jgi:hypothetical protein
VWPKLVADLEPLVRAQEGEPLARALASSEVSGFCGCDESDCFTFSTRASAVSEYDETILIEDAPALVALDISSDRRLLGVEILGWGNLRPSYLEFRERVRKWR